MCQKLSINLSRNIRLKNNQTNIDQVFIAIPSLKKNKCKEIIDSLNELKIPLMRVPSLYELTEGNSKIELVYSLKLIKKLFLPTLPNKFT